MGFARRARPSLLIFAVTVLIFPGIALAFDQAAALAAAEAQVESIRAMPLETQCVSEILSPFSESDLVEVHPDGTAVIQQVARSTGQKVTREVSVSDEYDPPLLRGVSVQTRCEWGGKQSYHSLNEARGDENTVVYDGERTLIIEHSGPYDRTSGTILAGRQMPMGGHSAFGYAALLKRVLARDGVPTLEVGGHPSSVMLRWADGEFESKAEILVQEGFPPALLFVATVREGRMRDQRLFSDFVTVGTARLPSTVVEEKFALNGELETRFTHSDIRYTILDEEVAAEMLLVDESRLDDVNSRSSGTLIPTARALANQRRP